MADIPIKMSLGEINPYIRLIRIHTIDSGFHTMQRYNRHYQLHYVFSGVGHFNIDGCDYTACKGDLCLWRPGQVHTIASEDMPVRVAGVQFDMTRQFVQLKYLPISYSSNNFSNSLIHENIEFTDFTGFPPFTRIIRNLDIENLLIRAESDFSNGGVFGEMTAATKLKEILLKLVTGTETIANRNQVNSLQADLISYIRVNFRSDLTNRSIANHFGYHPVHMNRIIGQSTGISLHQYLIQLRINEAIHLLETSSLSINQISEQVGYQNQHYFSRLFRLKTGFSPSDLRKGTQR